VLPDEADRIIAALGPATGPSDHFGKQPMRKRVRMRRLTARPVWVITRLPRSAHMSPFAGCGHRRCSRVNCQRVFRAPDVARCSSPWRGASAAQPRRLTRQFGRASAPIMPQRVHTIRGPNDGTGT
jgi:hypothetical protein